jgi:hypothetical protein
MGYTTDFDGSLKLSKQLTPEQKDYINLFSDTRRMKRDVNKLMELYGGKFGLVGITPDKTPEEIYGLDGGYFVMDDGNMGQRRDNSIIDYNSPPGLFVFETNLITKKLEENKRRIKEGEAQPGLWCQWVINNKNELMWDGNEKFYNYVEWLKYLIKNFFQPWGVLLNGEIEWEGEESSDRGKIVVTNNEVKVLHGVVTYH